MIYRRHSSKKLRQGDIAFCEFHQLRARSGDPRGPGAADLSNEDLPYFGQYEVFDVPIKVPGGGTAERQLRVWFGAVMVVHQNCEIEYADDNDSRLQVAPIVTREQWPTGPWELIKRGELPGYFALPSMTEEEGPTIGFEGAWPASAVSLASTTCLSRGIVKRNRMMAIEPGSVAGLQEALVRFSSVRGWGSIDALDRLVGMRVVSVKDTEEKVAGPAPLAKVVLAGEDDDDEIAVAWGVRRSGRSM